MNTRILNIIQTYKDKDLDFELYMNDGSTMKGNAVKLKVVGNQYNVNLTDKGGLFELNIPLNNIEHYLLSIDKEKNEEVLNIKTKTCTFNLFLKVKAMLQYDDDDEEDEFVKLSSDFTIKFE